ncbi:MAG: hypothetical protein J6I45_03970 [Clostridia bacterium]|nr:hypothetical protein [Clostridia bacterium]
MKRLLTFLKTKCGEDAQLGLMYTGRLNISLPNGIMWEDFDPTYYSDAGIGAEAGFCITRSCRQGNHLADITVILPASQIFNRGGIYMKRLKYYLLQMEEKTTTFKEMYDGKMQVSFPPKSNGDMLDPEVWHDSRYYDSEVSVSITQTNKLEKDVPTITLELPLSELKLREDIAGSDLAVCAADFCLRRIAPYFDELNEMLYNRARTDRENGCWYLHRPGGEILVRNSAYFAVIPDKGYEYIGGANVRVDPQAAEKPPRCCLCIQLRAQLPVGKIKRTIQMLCRDLPDAVRRFCTEFDHAALDAALSDYAKAAEMRAAMHEHDLCAFVADGSILPRASDGISPMKNALPFYAPEGSETFLCSMRGLGIKRGVNIICGGGYSGKSTLLDAISAGIYDHISGDGREFVLTDRTAVTVAAEDGRSVQSVNISPFIRWIPGADPTDFSTTHASGSTSQAANIMEAVEAGARLLLIDEDRSATNFMIRDAVMKELIEHEPIVPYTDRVREIFDVCGTSGILVIGGSGEYLPIADRVYLMDDFILSDATEAARETASRYTPEKRAAPEPADWHMHRAVTVGSISSYPPDSRTEVMGVSDNGFVYFGGERIDVRGIYDFISLEQTAAAAFILRTACLEAVGSVITKDDLEKLLERAKIEGLESFYSNFFTSCGRALEIPRITELMLLINRMRHVKFKKI